MRPKAQPFRPPKGCRRTRGSIAVVPSFSIHLSLCSTGFHRLPRYYEEIRLLREHRPVVVASFGSTARADPRRPPWVRTLDVPPLPPPLPPRPRLDFGRRVCRHADPAGSACSGVHFRSVLRFASGFFPTRPRGARQCVSRRQTLRAVASGSRLLPTRPAKDFHLQSSAHARHTRRATPSDRMGRPGRAGSSRSFPDQGHPFGARRARKPSIERREQRIFPLRQFRVAVAMGCALSGSSQQAVTDASTTKGISINVPRGGPKGFRRG